MTDKIISIKLNQQQTELLDQTKAKYPGKDRADIIVQALREYCEKHEVRKEK